METLKSYEIRNDIICIEHPMSHGVVRSFLIKGEDKAYLIDTGLGQNLIEDKVKSCTSLPITVIFTHSDGDHMGNADAFSERYMHPLEIKHYQSRKENPLSLKEITENDLIHCGEYSFEIILIPGHTPGSIALYDRQHRFMIGGDSLQCGPIFLFGTGRNLDAYLSSLEKIEKMSDRLDVIYASHNELEFNPQHIQQLKEGILSYQNNQLTGIPQERFENKVKKYEYKNISFYAE